jgi:hypothetical protein
MRCCTSSTAHRRFAHNPHGILATVGQFALMDIERGFDCRPLLPTKKVTPEKEVEGWGLDKTLVIQDNDKPLAVLLKYEHFLAMQEKMPDEE